MSGTKNISSRNIFILFWKKIILSGQKDRKHMKSNVSDCRYLQWRKSEAVQVIEPIRSTFQSTPINKCQDKNFVTFSNFLTGRYFDAVSQLVRKLNFLLYQFFFSLFGRSPEVMVNHFLNFSFKVRQLKAGFFKRCFFTSSCIDLYFLCIFL